MVLTFGSFATEIHEPCQVRNEAALSETFCVPEGSLDRANCIGNVCGLLFEVGRAVFYFIVDMLNTSVQKVYFDIVTTAVSSTRTMDWQGGVRCLIRLYIENGVL